MQDRQKNPLQSKWEQLESQARVEADLSQNARRELVLGYVNEAMSEFFGPETEAWPDIKIPERPEIHSTTVADEVADSTQREQDGRLVESIKQVMLGGRLAQAGSGRQPIAQLWSESISQALLLHPQVSPEQNVRGKASLSISLESPGCIPGIKRVRSGKPPEIPYTTLRTEVESDFASEKAEGETYLVSKEITYPQLWIDRTVWETVSLENKQVPHSFIVLSNAELAKPNTDRANWRELWDVDLRIGPESKALLPNSDKPGDWSLKVRVRNIGSEGTKIVSGIVRDKPLRPEFWEYLGELTKTPGVSIDEIEIKAGSSKNQTETNQKVSLFIPGQDFGPLSNYIGGPVILEEINGELYAGISYSTDFSPETAKDAINWIRQNAHKGPVENLLDGLFNLKPGERLKIKYPVGSDDARTKK